MAVTKTLTGALPYCKDSVVEKWDFVMKYEEGADATYYTSSYPITIPASFEGPDGSTITNFTPKAEALWTLAELIALCPTGQWDEVFAIQYDQVITNPPDDPEPDPGYVIPS